MSEGFRELTPVQLDDNPFQAIGRDAMLITAGTLASYNAMTASWGGWGHLWNRDVCFCFVRPQRYTFGYMERASHFTLGFFGREHAAAVDYCGKHSGRDVDKAAATGLVPVSLPSGAVCFAQARLVFECRKVYAADLRADSFVDPAIPAEVYAKADFHRMYIGEVLSCWVPEEPGQ